MGSSTSGVLLKIFLRYIEEIFIVKTARHLRLLGHIKYADDNLIIYDKNIIDINSIPVSCDLIRPQLHFILKLESIEILNFFYLSNSRIDTGL